MIGEIISANCVTSSLVVFVIILYLWFRQREKELPTGPMVYPVLGNLPSLMSRDVMKNFEKLRRQYGDVYGLYIGQEFTVVLNGYETIHDALVKKANLFCVRPRTNFHKLIFKTSSIVFANGTVWKEQRQFAQKALNEFGYSSAYKTIEERINDEIKFFIGRIATFKGPFNMRDTINLSVANVIAGILFGRRYDYDNPKFISCLDGVRETARLFARSSFLMSLFPFLRYLPGDWLSLNEIEKMRNKPKHFLEGPLQENISNFDQDRIDNVVDLYIQEIRENEKNGNTNSFSDYQMRALMGELLSAGSETTAISILWIILYLVRQPELQRCLREEIDSVIHEGKQPSLSDRSKLPLVEATILEGLRIAPVAPLSVPHAVHSTVEYKGYTIPKDTTILVNLHSVLKDPKIWQNPDEFLPQRFLDEQGKLNVPKEFIPFSVGRRSCLGESLARMELFLFVTTLLQRFELRTPAGQPKPSIEGHLGMTFNPYPFEIEALSRI